VTDKSGAAIAGAKISITEAERNVPHSVVSDEPGRYAVTALPPGAYSLTVEAPGFKRYVQTNIPLAVQQQGTFNVELEVGEITTSVEVNSQAPLLNTTIATLGEVIDERYMMSLPNTGQNNSKTQKAERNMNPQRKLFRCGPAKPTWLLNHRELELRPPTSYNLLPSWRKGRLGAGSALLTCF
jgi:hypothetical protein